MPLTPSLSTNYYLPLTSLHDPQRAHHHQLVPEAQGGRSFSGTICRRRAWRRRSSSSTPLKSFRHRPTPFPTATLWKLLNEHDLKLAAVEHRSRVGEAQADAHQRRCGHAAKGEGFVRSIIDFAGPYGAPAIIGSMQGRFGEGTDRETAIGYLEDALAELTIMPGSIACRCCTSR